ncbi:hypothetical protein GON05_16305 [Paenibacillus sp. MAH-34]|uniref:Cupin domain-containing protein n=1 Tax=Paenibacillus anseongense TaxID=2682845 RepID=A0ABW9U7U7_9BACL|nr:hypothetical protein [Paenibacillus anseongense]MVQ36184.1 hypothetical protein [Paenibacillus anseongense]
MKDDGSPLHLYEKEDESFNILDGEIEMTLGTETISVKKGEYICIRTSWYSTHIQSKIRYS